MNARKCKMRAATLCLILLSGGCPANEPPRAAPSSSCTRCETLLKATMLKAIDDEERHKRELTQARAGEGIAKAQAEQARKDEQEAAAWRQWGPLGIVGAFVAGALTAAALVVGAAK